MAKLKITPYQGKQLSLLDYQQEPSPVPRKLSSEWVASSVACQVLGFSIKHLTRLREDGTLKQGTHWRNISPTAARPTYRYHLKRCEAVLEGKAEPIPIQLPEPATQLTK